MRMRFQVQFSFFLMGGEEKLWNINYGMELACLEAKGPAFCSQSQPVIAYGLPSLVGEEEDYNHLSSAPSSGGK